MITKKELEQKIIQLEITNDILATELNDIHALLINIGFDDGIYGVKKAAQECIAMQDEDYDLYEY